MVASVAQVSRLLTRTLGSQVSLPLETGRANRQSVCIAPARRCNSRKAIASVATSVKAGLTVEERMQAKRDENSEKNIKVTQVDAAVQQEFNPATVVATRDVAPGVRCITIETQISREFVALANAYTKPGQSVTLRLQDGETVNATVSSPPFPTDNNWSVLYKMRGDIPAGSTKAAQYALSVIAPLDIHVTEGSSAPLYDLKPDTAIEVGPFQSNGLDLRPIMFLARFPTLLFFASGNGIAAARSLIEAKDVGSLFLGMRSDVRLYYSAASPSLLAYRDLFARWENLHVKVKAVVKDTEGAEWNGFVGTFASAFDEDDLEYDTETTGAVVFGDKASNEEALAVLREAGIPDSAILKWEA